MTRLRLRASAVLMAGMMASAAGAADQTVVDCSNDVELRADLTAMQQSGGGTLGFSCATSSIALTSTLPDITKNTKIDGGGKITLSGANSFRLFVIQASGSLELEDLVLTSGSSSGDGGAIFNSGVLTLRQVEVNDSVSGQSGGGLVTYGPLTIEDSTFASNRADNGAAVYARFPPAVVTIRDSVLHHNETTDKQAGGGGAVFLWDGATVTIDGTHLYDNRAVQGGAVNNQFSNSSVTIRDSVFERNFAGFEGVSSAMAYGGAVYSSAGALTVETTTIADSDAGTGGAGVYASGGTVTIEDSILRGGQSIDGGGIECVSACQLTMRRSTIYDNLAGFGAGAYIWVNSFVNFENVTFADNDAFYSGGALYSIGGQTTLTNSTVHGSHAGSGAIFASGSPTSAVSLRNTIVSGTSGSNCFAPPGQIVSLDGNLSDDDTCNEEFTGLHDLSGAGNDPLLVLSSTPSGSQLVYIPQPGSPAVDEGITGGAPSTDQRGVQRPQGIANDRGAVEVADCPGDIVCGDASADGEVAASDALLALRTAVGSGTCPAWRCDFNGDESVLASDALAILRTAVGQATTPNCPEAWDCVP